MLFRCLSLLAFLSCLASAALAAGKPHYLLREGDLYAYAPELTDDERNTAEPASGPMRVGYAGQRDGVFQVVVFEEPGFVYASQCTDPCDFIKLMMFSGATLVRTRLVRAEPGTIGWLALDDAIHGRLERYLDRRNGLPIWCDEDAGCKSEAPAGKPPRR